MILSSLLNLQLTIKFEMSSHRIPVKSHKSMLRSRILAQASSSRSLSLESRRLALCNAVKSLASSENINELLEIERQLLQEMEQEENERLLALEAKEDDDAIAEYLNDTTG